MPRSRRRRRKLEGLRPARPELAPFGATLGRTVTTCATPAPGRRVNVCVTRPEKPGPTVTGPQEACRILRDAKNADRESFYVLHLDNLNRVIGVEEAHKGTISSVEVRPAEVFKSALATNAAAIIVGHNHPSGDPRPSEADRHMTHALADLGQKLGVPVRDHVIVGAEGCYSFREGPGAHQFAFGDPNWPRRRRRRR